ncbi:MAG: RNA polymerase sigma-70 factor (ECF subfamily) [Bradymonadia bacterium]|jgi:RNA polymerase sigma-70 factor (ECF subfamily)
MNSNTRKSSKTLLSPKTRVIDPCLPADELLALMRAGDMVALDRMTRCYGASLAAVGRRHCRDSDQAEDAVQDALLAAGENLQGFRGEGSADGWLVRMVINACRRMRRGQKNNTELHDDVDEMERAGEGEDPESAASRHQIANVLANVLGELPPQDRALFLLAEAEEWTAPELAEEFGISAGAVRTRLTRIRENLRPELSAFTAG